MMLSLPGHAIEKNENMSVHMNKKRKRRMKSDSIKELVPFSLSTKYNIFHRSESNACHFIVKYLQNFRQDTRTSCCGCKWKLAQSVNQYCFIQRQKPNQRIIIITEKWMWMVAQKWQKERKIHPHNAWIMWNRRMFVWADDGEEMILSFVCHLQVCGIFKSLSLQLEKEGKNTRMKRKNNSLEWFCHFYVCPILVVVSLLACSIFWLCSLSLSWLKC